MTLAATMLCVWCGFTRRCTQTTDGLWVCRTCMPAAAKGAQ